MVKIRDLSASNYVVFTKLAGIQVRETELCSFEARMLVGADQPM
jgi:hypothetical protein